MLCFLDKAFILSPEYPHFIGRENTQVLFWFDISSYHMLFTECVEGFLGSYWVLEFCFQQAFSSRSSESSTW